MSPFRKTYEIIATAFTLLFGVVAILLAFGCASSGLYAMSDQWCAKHPGASVNRCTPDPSKATTYCRYGDHTGDPACGAAQFMIRLPTPEPISYPKYDTMEAAAIAALKAIAEKHNAVYEWGGAIGRTPDGKFVIGEPGTDFSGDSVGIDRDALPDFAPAVADYHTHPCLPHHYPEFFSAPDLFSVIFLHQAAAFMGDFCTGNVHEFKQGDQPDALKVNDHVWLTKGRIIGQFTTPKETEHSPTQSWNGSWDQERLKQNDRGCPTAIFIAPNGILEQCP